MTNYETVKLEKMVYGGDCLGRLSDGRAVFVPFTLPGETVQVELLEEKKRYARGRAVQILEASPDRISPRCQHFGECGGCAYQHLGYTQQLAFKKAIVMDQLQRIGKIDHPPVSDPVPSPTPWHYRNFVQFHPTADGKLGYIHLDGLHILPIEECHLPQKPINQLWPQIELGPETESVRLGIRIDTQDDLMLIIEGEDPTPPEFSVDIPISAVYTPPSANLTVMAGADHLIYEIIGQPFQVSARSFFQVNTAMAEKMVQHLLALLPNKPIKNLVELFAGVGLFSAFLASRVATLTAIESSGAACHDFAINLDQFENVALYQANVEAVLPTLTITDPPEMVVLDPPRAGLAPEGHDALMAMQPERMIYISCDPSTLARDARKIVKNGYQLLSVTPFDLFPQTHHIETISLFQRQKND